MTHPRSLSGSFVRTLCVSFLTLAGCMTEAPIGANDAASDAPPSDTPADLGRPDAPADVPPADVREDVCMLECPMPPPGCRYVGPTSCSPRSCGTLTCADAGPADAGPDVPVDADRDAGPARCARNADCPAGTVCEFAMGCDQTMGTCTSNLCQSLPSAPQYCGCDGRTIQQTSECRPDRPYASRGACVAPTDAGTFACGTSTCNPSAQFCRPPMGPGICPVADAGVCPMGCPGCPALPPPTCATLPGACASAPSCDCILRALCGAPSSGTCMGTAATGFTAGCLSA